MTDMLKLRQGVIAVALLLASLSAGSGAQAAITEEEAHAIGVDAYLYFYSPVTMDLTRKQLTNQEPSPGGIGGPMNRFANVGAFPAADMRVVVRPNFDTLYSSGWLDLTKEPMVVSVPDTGGRYYLLPMLDMWTDVFASPGWRTTGTGAGNFLVTPPGWRRPGDKFVEEFRLPDNTQRIDAPTPYVWIIGRTKTDGPADYDAVHKIQAGYKITPLSQWGKEPVAPEVKIDPSIDMKTPPKVTGRHHAGRQVLRLCRRAAQAASAAHHRSADHRAAEADRLRGRQELRPRQGRSGRAEGIGKRAGGRAEADGVESPDARPDRQWLVDEHRHHGRLRQLLPQARHRHSARPRRQSA